MEVLYALLRSMWSWYTNLVRGQPTWWRKALAVLVPVAILWACVNSVVAPVPRPAPTPLAAAKVVATATPVPTPRVSPIPWPPTPTPVPPIPTPALAPGELVQKIARDAFGDRLLKANLSAINLSALEAALEQSSRYPRSLAELRQAQPGETLNLVATVDYRGTFLSERDVINQSGRELKRLAPKLFAALADLDLLEVRLFQEFKDVYGHKEDEVAVKYSVSREKAARINWPEVEVRNYGIALDGVYVHPALRRAWGEIERQR